MISTLLRYRLPNGIANPLKVLTVTDFGGLLSTPPGLSRWNQGLVTTRGASVPFPSFQVGSGGGNAACSRQTIFHRDRPGGDAPQNP